MHNTLLKYKPQPLLFSAGILLVSLFFISGANASKQAITPVQNNSGASVNIDVSTDDQLQAQRALYKTVKKDLQRGLTRSFTEAHDQLLTYPLYPKLQYLLIGNKLSLKSRDGVDYFLRTFPETRSAKLLRRRWLTLLYRKKRWADFQAYYDKANTRVSLKCQYLYARYKGGEKTETIEEALQLWVVGKSQAKACDPIFELLIAQKKISEDIAWQRYTSAVLNHKFKLARYIKRFFISQSYKDKAEIYLAADQNPAQLEKYSELASHAPETLAVIEHGLIHLAKHDATKALKHWARYRQTHPFGDESQARLLPHFVRGLQRRGHGHAGLYYLNANIELADDKLLEWQLRLLLRANDWVVLEQWINSLPDAIRSQERWRYWQARALLVNNADPASVDRANTIFRELSNARSFYGFLSSDRVGSPYQMSHTPLLLKPKDLNDFANSPAVLRVRELFYHHENLTARREWYAATKDSTYDEWLIAAQIAHQQQWYQQAIISMAKARYWDDINIRFPLAYRAGFEKQSANVNLPLALLFAISRQESAFAADVTSPAGARGLMQLMPATAKEVARRHKIPYDNIKQLFDPSKNIALGSHYYKDMMLRFSNNRILATASYNAGPHRVDRWRKKTGAKLAYDVWIEMIPFSETRRYVQNVLTYSVIFAHHLGQPQTLMSSAEKQELL